MAWTTPRTFTAGETVNAGMLNTNIRDNIGFLHDRIQAGTVAINPVANTPTSVTVTFPVAFATAPRVTISAASPNVGTQVIACGADLETTTQFRATVYRTNTTTTNLRWVAITD